MSGTRLPDPVDLAIAAAAEPRAVEMIGVQVTIGGTGRPVQVVVPRDLTELELLELAGWMLTGLLPHLRTIQPTPASRLLVPS